jgi:hypothetical protein
MADNHVQWSWSSDGKKKLSQPSDPPLEGEIMFSDVPGIETTVEDPFAPIWPGKHRAKRTVDAIGPNEVGMGRAGCISEAADSLDGLQPVTRCIEEYSAPEFATAPVAISGSHGELNSGMS